MQGFVHVRKPLFQLSYAPSGSSFLLKRGSWYLAKEHKLHHSRGSWLQDYMKLFGNLVMLWDPFHGMKFPSTSTKLQRTENETHCIEIFV